MDRSTVPLLLTGFDDAASRLRDRLDGLERAEYLWEPVPDAWTVRSVDGRHVVEPNRLVTPAPVPTIAWRLWHIASDCLSSYVSPTLGDWPLPVGGGSNSLEWFDEPVRALDALDTAVGTFRDRITALGEDGIWSALGPGWGPFADDSWAALVVHANDELAHHGAEIALLRDLYRHLG